MCLLIYTVFPKGKDKQKNKIKKVLKEKKQSLNKINRVGQTG